MNTNENWTNQIAEGIARKSMELKQVLLANKLHAELEDTSLEQILHSHLPAADEAQLTADAREICRGVEEMYQSLNSQVETDQLEATLNTALNGRSMNEQGKYLVNLLRCFTASNHDAPLANPRWEALSSADTFSQDDINNLIAMVKEEFNDTAGFIARQEFQVMDDFMEKYSKYDLTIRVNSGERYAQAYAAAMYITGKRTASLDQISPHQLGLTATKSVESCKLLAMYHEGKIRLEELVPKLKKLMLNVLAIAVRAVMSWAMFEVAKDLLAWLAITSTTALWLVPVCFAVVGFFALNQEEAVNIVVDVWEGIKSAVRWTIRFFSGNSSDSTSNTVEVSTTVEREYIEQTASANLVTV